MRLIAVLGALLCAWIVVGIALGPPVDGSWDQWLAVAGVSLAVGCSLGCLSRAVRAPGWVRLGDLRHVVTVLVAGLLASLPRLAAPDVSLGHLLLGGLSVDLLAIAGAALGTVVGAAAPMEARRAGGPGRHTRFRCPIDHEFVSEADAYVCRTPGCETRYHAHCRLELNHCVVCHREFRR